MRESESERLEERVVVLAPTAKDAATTAEILGGAGIDCLVCKNLEEACAEMERGCGAAMLTQETILADRAGLLAGMLRRQPPWSDLPLVVLTPAGTDSDRAGRALDDVGHMTLMKRPVRIQALVSTIRAAIRDRRRQYANRDYFVERERQAEALRERDERFRATFAHASVGMTVSTLTARILEVNRAFCALTGYSEEELRNTDLLSITHPDDLETKRALLRRMVAGEIPGFGLEKRYVRKDGGVVWVVNSVSLIRDVEGKPTSIVVLTQDVSDRKEAEAARRDSEERYRTLAENVEHLFWTCSSDGRCDYLSSQWVHYTGIPETEQLGFNWLALVIHPDDRERTRGVWTAAVEDRGVYDLEYRIKGADGAYRWFKTRGTPIRDDAGAIVKWFGTCTDVDAQVKAEEALRRQAGQLRRLADVGSRINAAHDVKSVLGVVAEEARGLIGARHASAILNSGRPTASVARVEVGARGPSEDAPPDFSGLHARVCKTNQPMRLTRDDLKNYPAWKGEKGRRPTIHGWLAAPLIGRDGRNLGIVHLSHKERGEFTEDDESLVVQLAQMASVAVENARLYQELRERDQRKDEFLAMLAHELRNPLAAINNAVQVTSTAGGVHDEIEWSIEVVNRQVKHLARLIDDLLDVSRITRGKIRLRKENIDAHPVLNSAVEAVRPLVEERKHELSVSFQPGLRLDADPTRLEQIIVNLLTNAAKYTESGGKISLTARRIGDEIVFKVRDNGVGVPPEQLPQMFELFSQGDRTLARSEGGLGIGLTLVRSLAEMHGGSVSATSDGAGKGSEFVVRLPASKQTATAAMPKTARAAARASRILVVDDNMDTARGMSKLLALLGHDVRTARDGPSAIELAHEFKPEFVLLDIGLPGMDGYQVASILKQGDDLKGALVVAVSGYGQDDDRRRSREAGFDHHLVKPVDFDALMALLAGGEE